MRNSKLSAQEIEAAEMAADSQRRSRNNGFSLMAVRDRGAARLSNGSVIEWAIPKEERKEGILYPAIPEGHFRLDGKLFDHDEFLKYTRWI